MVPRPSVKIREVAAGAENIRPVVLGTEATVRKASEQYLEAGASMPARRGGTTNLCGKEVSYV
jgi:hypothetical protein